MINYIIGELIDIENNNIVLDKDGLAFDIYFPKSNMLNIKIGDKLKVYIHMSFSQDDISLYGFLTKEDKQMFELLLIVNRLGPKGAMNIISNLGSSKVKSAILKKESKVFSSVSGIGSKVADKIIIDLYDKVKNIDINTIDIIETDDKKTETKKEAVEALITLGLTRKVALTLVDKVEITDNTKVDDVIKLALQK